MDKLPSEILKEIFILLHQKHKLECMTVCSRWESIIKTTCLFHTIIITTKNQQKNLHKRLENDPDQGASQVDTFILFENHDWTSYTSRTLCLFRNPRFLCLPYAFLEDYMSEDWSHRLEYLYCDDNFADQLIGSYTYYPRLKGIFCRKLVGRNDPTRFISNLSSTRTLRQLTMEAYSIMLSDIEMIHESATMLESLYLMYTEIPEQDQDISDVLESDIVPATSVTSFTLDIQNAVSPDDIANFLIYVSRKYPNLQNFEISDTYLGLYDDFIEHIYTNGFLPLISKLRPTLQNITTCLLPTGLASDLFKALDESQCRIQQLTLKAEPYIWDFHSFQSIEQLKYIQVLKLERFSCTHFQWLGDFNVLKQLNLSFSQDEGLLMSVQLNEIVHFCQNTVETIILQQVILTCKHSKDIQLPSLKKLELFKVELGKDTDIFISKSLPNLRYLTLLYYGPTGMYFCFPNLDLYCLDIRNCETEEAEILKVDVGGEHRFYAKSKFNRHEAPPREHMFKYDERMFPPNELWNNVASNDEPITTIVCASIRNVVY